MVLAHARIDGAALEAKASCFMESTMMLPERRPTEWVDTCVMLDFYSQISAYKNAAAGATALEATRRQMRAANWLAMASDKESTVTVSFEHENVRNLLTKAAPGTSAGAWSAAAVWILKDHVCPEWEAHLDPFGEKVTENGVERETTNDERDQIMVDAAKRDGLTVITTDGGARKRARKDGVPVKSPEEFAASVISFEDARAKFFKRLDLALLKYTAANYLDPKAAEAAKAMRDLYDIIWAD
jgi:hypothetical protein